MKLPVIYLTCDICKIPCIGTDLCWECRDWAEETMFNAMAEYHFSTIPESDEELQQLLCDSLEMLYGSDQDPFGD